VIRALALAIVLIVARPAAGADPPGGDASASSRKAAAAASAIRDAEPTGSAKTAAGIRAVATASKTEVSVGESFAIEVRATGPAGTTFEFAPDAVQESFELHTAPADSLAPAPGTHRYRAAVFTIGDAQVPPIPVRYRTPDGATGQVETAAIPLRVLSLLPKDEAERKLADVHGPIGVAIGRVFWIALAVLLLLAVFATWWIVSRRRAVLPAAVPSAPPIEPDEEARRALAALAASGRLERAEYRLFYIDLTAIAKRYLERRLAAPIVEMTSVETIAYLRGTTHGSDLAPTLRDLTTAADQIKFARGSGLVEEAERHLGATRALVETLEARLKPPPSAGEQAA
jgi:hypothetical protein